MNIHSFPQRDRQQLFQSDVRLDPLLGPHHSGDPDMGAAGGRPWLCALRHGPRLCQVESSRYENFSWTIARPRAEQRPNMLSSVVEPFHIDPALALQSTSCCCIKGFEKFNFLIYRGLIYSQKNTSALLCSSILVFYISVQHFVYFCSLKFKHRSERELEVEPEPPLFSRRSRLQEEKKHNTDGLIVYLTRLAFELVIRLSATIMYVVMIY